MKSHERGLLKFLNCSSYDQQDILKNIKEGMGSLREIEGNPLFKSELAITVTKNYFLNGQQIAPAALPLALQTELPFYIFGLSDSHTSYANSRFYFNGFEPWIVPDNSGQRLGPELFDWTAAMAAAYWNIIDPGWIIGPTALSWGGGGQGHIERFNFWRQNQKYKITYKSIFAPNRNIITANQIIVIHNVAPIIDMNVIYENGDFSVDFLTAPNNFATSTPDLIIRVTNDALGNIGRLDYLSIKEIQGFDLFSGDPAFGIYGFTKTGVLSQNVQRGDAVLTYVSNVNGVQIPDNWTRFIEQNYVCEIIIHCNNIPYGSLLQSLASDMLVINQIRYNVPPPSVATPNTILQFNNPLIFLYQQMLGKMKSDSVDPNMFNTPDDFQNQICDIPVKVPIDRNFGIGSNINFDINNLSFTFFVSKVEPLTLRSKYK
jgi:hypothetical protein